MAALPKLGSPALAMTLLAVWSGGKTVDWCRYFQYLYSVILDPAYIHRLFVVQAHFTFVECGIKRSSHAFCGRPTKLAQSLYCRCAPPTKSINKQPSNQIGLSISLQSPSPNKQTSNILLKSVRSPTIIISDWIKYLACSKRDLTPFKMHKVCFNHPSKVLMARPCVV